MKKFFPLWYIDIIKTENKLSQLSEKGLHMTGLSYFMGIFSFEKGENKKERYRICPARGCGGEPPKGLAAGGWEKVCGGKNYYVVKNADTNAENVPSYSKWKTYNRLSLYAAFMFFSFTLGLLLSSVTRLLDNIGTGTAAITDSDIIAHLLIFAVGLIPAARLFISNRRLAKTDTDLELKGKVIKTVPEENFLYTPKEEKQMLKDGRMMKKFPLGWFYAPDRVEEMVEKLAAEGWKFYRFNQLGTVFYFVKSEPCKLKIVVDYQNEAKDEYFLNGKDDGWKLEFTSVSRLQCFVVWSKEYEGDEAPEFYSDGETKLKHARRMAYTFGTMLTLFALMMIFSLSIMAIDFMTESMAMFVYIVLLFMLVMIECGVFASRAIGYYIRTKRIYNNKK
ncbi:MAG: DUF2812 domain-containing protein [Oscillospiraceae bacterium]|nr:DUF2812 domain-containing protein [Oscillospiraceae bacterium]